MKKLITHAHHGFLCSFEGLDGSGKTTLIHAVYEYFRAQNRPVLLTKEPGASDLGKVLRTIVQEKKVNVCPEAEFLLFAADRAQHMKEIILPALEKGTIVFSDRMNDSSLAYQGYGRGLDQHMITTINAWVMQQRMPDLVVYVRVTPDVAMQRIMKRNIVPTAFEKEKEDFIMRVYQGFEEIFKTKKNGIIIDGMQSEEEVRTQTIQAISAWLNRT